MKTHFLILFTLVILTACSQKQSNSNTSLGKYGDTAIVTDQAIPAEQLLAKLEGNDSLFATVKGTVTAACQTKGCWMDMALNEQQNMRVTFKDYGFFVPKNSAEHQATIKGVAFIDTISVAVQKEWAKDANKSEEEIASITEPKISYRFVADGVIFNE